MKYKKHNFVCLLMALVLSACNAFGQAASASYQNLIENHLFTEVKSDGAPAGWHHNTHGQGVLVAHPDAEPAHVRIGIGNGPEDSFIQQIVAIPDNAVRLRLRAVYRHDGIVAGEKGYQTGFIQARFIKDGKETGAWIDLAKPKGSSDGWIATKRDVGINPEAQRLMLRVGLYGCKAGVLDVAEAGIEVLTHEDIAVEREAYRPPEPFGPEVSDTRYGRLSFGININGWFCQPWNQKIGGVKGGFNEDFLRAYITDADLSNICKMGYNHVRLPIDPIFLFNATSGATNVLNTTLLPELDTAIERIRAHGLAVIVDVHPKSPLFRGMAEKADICEAFILWWRDFARHMASNTDPEWVFLELLNEPGGQKFWANQAWSDYQDRLITVIRASAPDHTLIANGGAYQLVPELGRVIPHPDRNIIWAVHYYEPSPFTHQGAVWMKDWYQPLYNVPWPFTDENLSEAVVALKDHKNAKAHAEKVLRDQVARNLATHEHMAAQIKQIADWAESNNRRVHIGEYGVVDWAPRDSRIRYLGALNALFDQHRLGRAMWNYSGSAFSTVVGPDEPGQRVPDTELIKAMRPGK